MMSTKENINEHFNIFMRHNIAKDNPINIFKKQFTQMMMSTKTDTEKIDNLLY